MEYNKFSNLPTPITRKKTEDWIKCELYKRLTDKGYECYPEVVVGRSRVDLVVFNSDRFLLLIEVKDYEGKVNKETRQFKKYKSLGHPFTYCMGESDMDKVIRMVDNIHNGVIKTKEVLV